MQGAERGPKWAGLERANLASHRTLLCLHTRKAGQRTGRNITEWEIASVSQPCSLLQTVFAVCVICCQRDQHKLHKAVCFRCTHNECPRRECCCSLHSSIGHTLPASSSKQASNRGNRLHGRISLFSINPISGPSPTGALEPTVWTKLENPWRK